MWDYIFFWISVLLALLGTFFLAIGATNLFYFVCILLVTVLCIAFISLFFWVMFYD